MKSYWCFKGEPRTFPRFIEVTRAEHPRDACAAFDVPFPSNLVHELASPRLQKLCAALAPGEVGLVHADRSPSSRDWFTEKGFG